jgi:hypothetical protein
MVLSQYKARLMQRIELFVGIFFVLLASIFVVVILPSAGKVMSGSTPPDFTVNQATWTGCLFFYVFFPLTFIGVWYGSLSNMCRRKYQIFAVEHRIAAKGGSHAMPASRSAVIKRHRSLRQRTKHSHANIGSIAAMAVDAFKEAGEEAQERREAEMEELDNVSADISEQLDELLDSMTEFTEKIDAIMPISLFEVPLDTVLVSSLLTVLGSAVFLTYRLFS